MRTNAIAALLACLLLACESSGSGARPPSRNPYPSAGGPAASQERSSGERMFYPERGVSCDRATQVCYVGSRADVSQTRAWFGDSAARRLQNSSGNTRPDPKWVYEPEQGTSCDMRTQVCYGAKGPNLKQTRRYFGEEAAARLEQNLGRPGSGTDGVTRQKHGVGCDQRVQICYDVNGPNVKQTRKYFGDAAAKALEKQLKR